MKYIFPSVCVLVAAYMWKINQSNSDSILGLGLFFAIAFYVQDWWTKK